MDIMDYLFQQILNLFGWIFKMIFNLFVWLIQVIFVGLFNLISSVFQKSKDKDSERPSKEGDLNNNTQPNNQQ